METVELACEKRELKPKRAVNRVRREGRVPAVIYGAKSVATAVAVPGVELLTRVRSAAKQRLIRLKSTASELDGRHVILKDIQRTAVDGKILHVDFYEVDLTRPLRVSVPLRFTGRAVGVADGGILQPLEREVEVECLPLEIPEAVEVDVSSLGIHDVMHISALTFAANLRPIFDSDFPVVTVLPPTVAEAPVAAAAAVEGEVAPTDAAAAVPAAAGTGEGATKEAAAPAAGGKKG
jgi:large subunit ribosomal protein L25